MIFMALCCDCGLIAKKLISPFADLITESLHIPGGIATGISLMFIIVPAASFRIFGCATLMSVIQSVLALSFGMVGSMGALAPIGYIIPGIVIDLCLFLFRRSASPSSGILAASIAASVSAALTADILVFRLYGIALCVYIAVAATTGAVCSLPASVLAGRISSYISDRTLKEDVLS